MAVYLGIDTSNYTTSAALYDTETRSIVQAKKLLPVKSGEKGLRQSDAVFHHTVQLPQILGELTFPGNGIEGIGVSVRPRNAEGSYMPCFLCGESAAQMLGQFGGVPVYRTSHQIGHILAALYSADALDLIHRSFLAFHVSGGTTDCVYCEPDEGELLRITHLAGSLDLKAGQAVDRVGVMLGLQFPCGPALEALAAQSSREFRYRPTMKGMDCCLSGLENQCASALKEGEAPCDVAKRCLSAIADVLLRMTELALTGREVCPVVYAGGVMSNKFIQGRLQHIPGALFAQPQFSCDNAAGTAIYAACCAKGGV